MTERNRRILVIFNPKAGGDRRRRLDETLAHLHSLGCTVTVRETAYPRHAEEIARGLDPATLDVVVAAGGDGTINEVANGLAGTDLPLAIIPLGTANVLALEIGMPAEPRGIAMTIADGRAKRIYLGQANGRRFVLMTGVGFDAYVVAHIRPHVKRLLGKFAYVLETFTGLVRFPFRTYRVTIDGQAYQAASAVISKARSYGGPFTCAPEARLDDPRLFVCVFRHPGRLWTIRYALWLLMGRLHRLKDVTVVPARNVLVEGPDGEPVQGDGDVLTGLPLRVSAGDETLRLIVPA